MPKGKQHGHTSRSANRGGGDNGSASSIRISWATIGGLAGLLVLLGGLYSIATKIATKSDIDSLKTTIAPTLSNHEDRLRSLELQMAAHFGASPNPTMFHQNSDDEPALTPRVILAQFNPQQYPVAQGAPPAIPAPQANYPKPIISLSKEMIADFRLNPTRGGTYALLGEDGKYYSLDEVIAVVCEHIIETRHQEKR